MMFPFTKNRESEMKVVFQHIGGGEFIGNEEIALFT